MNAVLRPLLVVSLVTFFAADALGQDQGRAGRGAGADAGRGRGARGRGAGQQGPWFGVMLPPPLGKDPAVIVGERPPRPFVMPQGEPAAPELAGSLVRADVETIVGFAKESRRTKEFGSGQTWGRVSGFPSSAKTVDWAVPAPVWGWITPVSTWTRPVRT